MSDGRTGVEARHRQMLAEGRFMIQRCAGCRAHVHFPRVVCPHCGGGALDWVEPAGGGAVYSATTVRRKAEAGGDYNVALIDLDEGVRLMSRVEGIAPDAVRIGMRVVARVAVSGDTGLVVFDPVEGA